MMPEYLFSFKKEGWPEEESYFVRDASPGTCFEIFLDKYALNENECIIVKLEKIYSSEECQQELEESGFANM